MLKIIAWCARNSVPSAPMRKLAVALGMSIGLLGVGCFEPPVDGPDQVLTVRIGLEGDVCGVTSADATVSAPGMATIGPVPLSVGQLVIEGQLKVPAGRGRTVYVAAYNSSGQRVYRGTALVDVTARQITTANIVLQQDTANCVATGTVIIVGTIAGGSTDGGTPMDGGVADAGVVLSGPGLAFTFADVELTTDGVLHFFDVPNNRIHRLDLDTKAMSTPLVGTLPVASMAVAPDGTEAYLGYTGGRIDSFDLVAGTSRFFGAAPETVSTMIVAGSHLFAIDASGAWDSHSLFDRATGARVAYDDWRNTSRSIVYSPLHQRVYFLNSGVSPTDIDMVSVSGGMLGGEDDSPYHGDYSLPNPIRLLPDQSGVIVGSGNIFNASDLTYRSSIGLTFTDVAFHSGKMYLIDSVGTNTQIRVLDSALSIVRASYYPGKGRRIFAYQGQLVLVTENNGGAEVRLLAP